MQSANRNNNNNRRTTIDYYRPQIIIEEYDDDNPKNNNNDDDDDDDAIIIIISHMKVEENEDLLAKILSFLDTASLIQKKQVSIRWKRLCTHAIDRKLKGFPSGKPSLFASRCELRNAINDYVESRWNPHNAEEIASVYGWPIGKWSVSHITDFSRVFREKRSFNEDIGSWDVSNAVDMSEMFWNATSFNQNISTWNTKNVRTMGFMFYNAKSFNQDISPWNTKNAKSMRYMFMRASSFNHDISLWNTRKIKENRFIFGMFDGATMFNREKYSPQLRLIERET